MPQYWIRGFLSALVLVLLMSWLGGTAHAWTCLTDVVCPPIVLKAVVPSAPASAPSSAPWWVTGWWWATPYALLELHDLLYYGWDGLFPVTDWYVAYCDRLNAHQGPVEQMGGMSYSYTQPGEPVPVP